MEAVVLISMDQLGMLSQAEAIGLQSFLSVARLMRSRAIMWDT